MIYFICLVGLALFALGVFHKDESEKRWDREYKRRERERRLEEFRATIPDAHDH
jgi:hypothetical protein